ncbi:MAG: hypothetical protein WCE50_16615, partial [Candidatus Acidiferrum sp.]
LVPGMLTEMRVKSATMIPTALQAGNNATPMSQTQCVCLSLGIWVFRDEPMMPFGVGGLNGQFHFRTGAEVWTKKNQ